MASLIIDVFKLHIQGISILKNRGILVLEHIQRMSPLELEFLYASCVIFHFIYNVLRTDF